MNFIVRWIVTSIAVSIAIALVPGINFVQDDDLVLSIVVLSVFLALVNTTIKPILQGLSLPISILTLGLFALVVNTGMLYLASYLASELFHVTLVISDFGSAFMASIIISISTWVISTVAPWD